jgi:hypothetical protein
MPSKEGSKRWKKGGMKMSDIYKKMCVHQGYVPPTCTLDGKIAYMLAYEGKDPCKGCNADREICKGRIKE